MKRKGFFRAAIRGLIKSLPFGNVAMEIVDNTKANLDSEIGHIDSNKLPHDWFSISVQILGIAGIVYAFITKQITVDHFIELLK